MLLFVDEEHSKHEVARKLSTFAPVLRPTRLRWSLAAAVWVELPYSCLQKDFARSQLDSILTSV